MKQALKRIVGVLAALTAFLSISFESLWATSPPAAWSRQQETTQSLQAKGFTFTISTLPQHLFETKHVELTVLAPDQFVFAGLTNTYSSILLMNDDVAADIAVYPSGQRHRAVITMSETAAKKSKLIFYYNNATEGVTGGTQYIVQLRDVIGMVKTEAVNTNAEKQAITVSLAIPLHDNERHLKYTSSCPHFPVIITNVSKKRVRIWRDWCSWGYYGLEFEITDNHGKTWTAKKTPAEFTRNFPDWWTLEAGESFVIDVDFASDSWQGFPHPANGSETVTIRAICTFEPDAASKENHIWTGRAASEPKKVIFDH